MPHYAIALLENPRITSMPTDAGVTLHPLSNRWQVACLPLAHEDLAQFTAAGERDPLWLAQALARQHAVIARISAALPVYPLVFGSLLPDFVELNEAANRSQALLDEYFTLVRGCGEWGLRIRVHGEALEEPAPSGSGLAWLQHRRDAARRRQERRRDRLETALALLATHLDDLLRARSERPLSAREDDAELLLNLALLVPFAAEDALEGALQALDQAMAPHGLSLRVSGPWAPYSFRPRLGEVAL